jgi:hypothetical protein
MPWVGQVLFLVWCSGQRELCTPSGQTLDTYSTLGEKIRGPDFDTFSPGTEYNFARNSFVPQVWRPGIRHQCYWLQINIIHVELVLWTFLETDMAITQLPINHQHTSYMYMKLSVHCAFEQGFIGLRYVYDVLTTDNSTSNSQGGTEFTLTATWVGRDLCANIDMKFNSLIPHAGLIRLPLLSTMAHTEVTNVSC